jgi:hypothetical protein
MNSNSFMSIDANIELEVDEEFNIIGGRFLLDTCC